MKRSASLFTLLDYQIYLKYIYGVLDYQVYLKYIYGVLTNIYSHIPTERAFTEDQK